MAYSTLCSDTFNRANGTLLGTTLDNALGGTETDTWASGGVGQDWTISGNRIVQPSAANTVNKVAGTASRGDCRVSITIGAAGGTVADQFILARYQSFSAGFAGYWLGVQASSVVLKIYVDGATLLATGTTTVHAGDVIMLECIGTTFNGYINGVLEVTATNSAQSSGVPAFYGGGLGTGVLDNFLYEIPAASVFIRRVVQSRGHPTTFFVRAASKLLVTRPVGNATPLTKIQRVIASNIQPVRPPVKVRHGLTLKPAPSITPVSSTKLIIAAKSFFLPPLIRAASRLVVTRPVGNLTPLFRSQRVVASKPPEVVPNVRGKQSTTSKPALALPPVTSAPPLRVITATKAFIAPWFTRGKVVVPRLGALIAIPKHGTIRSGPPAVKPIDHRSTVLRPSQGTAPSAPGLARVIRSMFPIVKPIDRRSTVTRPAQTAAPSSPSSRQIIRSVFPAVKPIDRRSTVTRPAQTAAPSSPSSRHVIRSLFPAVGLPATTSRVVRHTSSVTPPPPHRRAIASSLRIVIKTLSRAFRGLIGAPAPPDHWIVIGPLTVVSPQCVISTAQPKVVVSQVAPLINTKPVEF